MNEREYYEKIYSKFWSKQTKIYGFSKYEQFIVKKIIKHSPKSVFEVGIGTGYPIALALQKSNNKLIINGCDVAKLLVEQAKDNLNVLEGIWTGALEDLNISRKYDCVYCVRTSWYIPDFYKTLEKMISMTKPGGYVIFDIMDDKSLYYWKTRIPYIKKFILGVMNIKMDDIQKLHFYSVLGICMFLKKRHLKYKKYVELNILKNKDYFNTPKKLFVCQIP